MDDKNYHQISGEGGTIHISHAVVAEIASIACLEAEGVAALSSVAESSVKGVIIRFAEDGRCEIDAHILVKSGFNLSDTAEKAQLAIKNAVESSSGAEVLRVNVFVAGVTQK